jgi:multidrug resistance efflux pump
MREILFKASSILSILAFLICNFQTENDSVNPSVTNITESVYASVTVRPRKTYYPQPLRSGIIQNIYVEEGDIIDQGDKLFDILATEEVRSKLENAELNLEEARFNYQGENNMLLNMEAEIRSIRYQLNLDSINYERQKRLWSQNIGKKIDLDQSSLKYNTNKNKLKILEQKLAQTKINLEKNYQKSLNQVRAQKSFVQDYTVRTKMGGKVFSLFKEEGDLISSQERFAEIGTSNDFILEMNIDEVDITKINIGDTVWSYPLS